MKNLRIAAMSLCFACFLVLGACSPSATDPGESDTPSGSAAFSAEMVQTEWSPDLLFHTQDGGTDLFEIAGEPTIKNAEGDILSWEDLTEGDTVEIFAEGDLIMQETYPGKLSGSNIVVVVTSG